MKKDSTLSNIKSKAGAISARPLLFLVINSLSRANETVDLIIELTKLNSKFSIIVVNKLDFLQQKRLLEFLNKSKKLKTKDINILARVSEGTIYLNLLEENKSNEKRIKSAIKNDEFKPNKLIEEILQKDFKNKRLITFLLQSEQNEHLTEQLLDRKSAGKTYSVKSKLKKINQVALNAVKKGIANDLVEIGKLKYFTTEISKKTKKKVEAKKKIREKLISSKNGMSNLELLKQIDFLKNELSKKDLEIRKKNEERDESQNAYNSIVTNAVSALLLGKPDGTVLAVNQAACELFGYTQEEFLKLQRADIIDVTSVVAKSQIAERNEKGIFIGVMTAIKKGGAKFPCEVRSSIFSAGDGTLRTSTSIIDLTVRLKQEQDLELTNSNLSLILDNTEEVFFVVDVELKIITYNKKAELEIHRLFGRSFKIGDSILSIADEARRKDLKETYAQVIKGKQIKYKYFIGNEGKNSAIFELKYTPIKNQKGIVNAIMVGARDISEEENAFNEISKQQQLLKEAEYLAHVGSWDYDIETEVLNWSDEYYRICGYEPKSVKISFAYFASKILHNDDKKKFNDSLIKMFESGEPLNLKLRIITKDKQNRITENKAHLLKGPSGKLTKVVGIVQDVTEKYEQEHLLQVSEDKYKAMFYSNPLPMFLFNLVTWDFLEVNNAAIIHYGYSMEEFLAMTVADIRPKEDYEKFKEILDKNTREERKVFHGYSRHLKKNGDLITVLVTSNRMIQNGKQVALVLVNDVTEKLRIEKEIDVVNKKTKTLINSTNDLIWSIDTNKKLTACNDSFISTIAYISGTAVIIGEDLVSERYFEKSELDFWTKLYDRVLLGEKYSEITFANVNNGLIWHETFFNPIVEGGIVVGAAMYSRDITERKVLEDKQLLLASVVNSSDDAIISKTVEGLITSWNIGAEKIFGYAADEVIGKPMADIIPPELVKEEEFFIETIKSGKFIEHYETIRQNKNKNLVVVSITISPIRDANNNVVGASEIARDITEKKQKEDQLHQNLREISDYKFALDQSSIVSISDKDGTIIFANDNLCRISKFSKKELIGKNHRVFNSGFHTEEFFFELWTTILNGKVWRGELKNRAKDGSFYWVDATIVPFLNEKGEPFRFIAIRSEITKRKITETKLLESNERFEYVAKATFDAVWDWDLVTNKITWGDGFKTIFGFNLNNNVTDISEWMNKIHVNDFERVQKKIKTIVDGGANNCGEEFQFLKGNEQYAYVSNKSVIVRNETGKAIRMIGAMQDISKRKQEELRLKLLESVVLNAKDSVMITDGITGINQSPKILYVNDAFLSMTGYEEHEVIGRSPKILQGPKTDQQELKKMKIAMENLQACEVEVINYKKSGEEFWVRFSVVPIITETGELTHFVAIERDVTLQKKLNEEKKRILESISDCFFVLDKEFKISYMNSASEKLLNLKSGELDGIVLWEKYPSLANGVFYEKLKEVVETKLPAHFEYYFEKDDKWYDESIFPAEEGVSVFFKPIDDRKKAEELLKAALTEKNEILESFGDGFFALDNNWVVTYWNNKAEKITRIKREFILHRDFRSKLKSNLTQNFYDNLSSALNDNKIIHFVEFSALYNQWFEISAYPSKKGLSVYFKNVSDRVVAEENLTKLNAELKIRAEELSNSNTELERFAYVASHDLQEPLRMVSSFLQLLQKKYTTELDETGNKYIHYAVDGAERMKVLINELLHYSRIGTAAIERVPIDMNEIVNDVLLFYKDKNIKINLKKLPIIAAGKTSMTQLLQNLIGNAVKYNTTEQPVLSIESTETDDCWQFSIQDNGIGIDEKFFDKIFVVFQRLHNKDEYSGTGVGLAICRKIVERYKGKIWVESELGKGSKFIFTIAKK